MRNIGGSKVGLPAGGVVRDRHGELPDAARSELGSVFEETVALFLRLRAVIERVHRQGKYSSTRRSILQELDRFGERTVPQMARARSVSRQHIQGLVNELERDGRVELVDNPAHKRSRLVRLTSCGEELVEEMDLREAELLAKLEIDVPEEDLRIAAEVLGAIRRILESGSTMRLLEEGREQ